MSRCFCSFSKSARANGHAGVIEKLLDFQTRADVDVLGRQKRMRLIYAWHFVWYGYRRLVIVSAHNRKDKRVAFVKRDKENKGRERKEMPQMA
jgi:hypothetical protein